MPDRFARLLGVRLEQLAGLLGQLGRHHDVDHDVEIAAKLKEKGVELICLAGYMRLLSPRFIQEFPDRIVNIHPSLLPAFPGLDAQKQAFDHGVKITGCTVHFVNEDLDAGRIVLQRPVEVKDGDTAETLAERILEEEHKLYVEAVKRLVREFQQQAASVREAEA